MRERVTIKPLTTQDQLDRLKPWLETFDHKPVSINPVGRFHIFTRMERVLALTQQITLNALFPAVNPKVCTPRETSEIVSAFHAWNSNTPGGLVVAVPHQSHMHEHMADLGYKPHAILYESV